jgi:hypothetical protein
MRISIFCLAVGGPSFPFTLILAGGLFFLVALALALASTPFFGADLVGSGDHLHRGLFLGCAILSALLVGLFPLDLFAHPVRRPNRLDVGGLEDLTLSEWGDHVAGSRVSTGWGVFPHQAIGHSLSVGVVAIGFELGSEGLHFRHAYFR